MLLNQHYGSICSHILVFLLANKPLFKANEFRWQIINIKEILCDGLIYHRRLKVIGNDFKDLPN